MKIIKVAVDLTITVHDFPEGTHEQVNRELRKLIGPECDLYEHVMPRRLYTMFGMSNRPTKIKGQCVSMLVDEEFLLREQPVPNYLASYLYETDVHGSPICGDVLFVGEEWGGEGIDFCGIDDGILEDLMAKLTNMVMAMKALKEVRG